MAWHVKRGTMYEPNPDATVSCRTVRKRQSKIRIPRTRRAWAGKNDRLFPERKFKIDSIDNMYPGRKTPSEFLSRPVDGPIGEGIVITRQKDDWYFPIAKTREDG